MTTTSSRIVPPVPPPRSPRASRRAVANRAGGPTVRCVFCREPIEIGSFVAGASDPAIRSTACSNCGLMVSATSTTLAAWSRRGVASDQDDDLAGRLRARRVAMGTRAILERVGASDLLEERAG